MIFIHWRIAAYHVPHLSLLPSELPWSWAVSDTGGYEQYHGTPVRRLMFEDFCITTQLVGIIASVGTLAIAACVHTLDLL